MTQHLMNHQYLKFHIVFAIVPWLNIYQELTLSSWQRQMYIDRKHVGLMLVAAALVLAPIIAGNASAAPNTKVRAIQNGVSLDENNQGSLGFDIDCVAGIEGSGTADEVKCYLVPDGIPTPSYATTPIPPQTSTTEGSCPSGVGFTSGYVCFSTTFDSSLFTQGHWRFVAEYYNNGQLVDIKGSNTWTNHSFFVLPESPIGILALVVSSLVVLGGFMVLRGRTRARIPV